MGITLTSIGGASGVAAAPYALCSVPVCPSPSRREKTYICHLDPSRSLSQRKFYEKNPRNVSMLNFFLFPVVNGQSTCC